MDLKSKLKLVVQKKKEEAARKNIPEKSDEVKKAEEMEQFTDLYTKWKGKANDDNKSYKKIPRFYYRLPSEDEVLLQKLREESRAVFLQRKSRL